MQTPKQQQTKQPTDTSRSESDNGYLMPRQPGRYDVHAACEECCVQDFGPSLTQQSQAEDADINVMMERFGVTGQLPENVRVPTYGDFTGANDYASAIAAIHAAEDAFMKMPAQTRYRFSNDPQQFLEFCNDPANIPEMVQMGLAVYQQPAGAPAPGTQGQPPAVNTGLAQTGSGSQSSNTGGGGLGTPSNPQ